MSEPRHQCLVPVHCSFRVLDSSPGVQGTPFMVSLGEGRKRGLPPPTSVLHFWKVAKIDSETDALLDQFCEPTWLQLRSNNQPKCFTVRYSSAKKARHNRPNSKTKGGRRCVARRASSIKNAICPENHKAIFPTRKRSKTFNSPTFSTKERSRKHNSLVFSEKKRPTQRNRRLRSTKTRF